MADLKKGAEMGPNNDRAGEARYRSRGRATACSPAGHLAGLMADAGGPETAEMSELPFLAQVEIRIDPEEEAAASRMAEEFLRVPLPALGQATGYGSPHVLCCGPGWYLVVDDTATGPGLAAGLAAALGGEYGTCCAAVADLSAQRAVLEVRGPYAADVLARGCPLDLHPRVFPPGRYAQSLLGRASVGVQRIHDDAAAQRFRVFVRASYAEYAVRFLAEAMDGTSAAAVPRSAASLGR